MHNTTPPLTNIPEYKYSKLKKGIICGLLRSIEEFKLLFPEKTITTNGIFEWYGVIESKKTIRRVLKKNYKIMFHSTRSYFAIPEDPSKSK